MREAGSATPAAAVKEQHLKALLRDFGSVCIGYSGGVDSAYLARVALDALGPGHVLAVTGVSPSVSAAQLANARSIATGFDIPHLEVETREGSDPRYARNGPDRCYFCKTELWTRLSQVARDRGIAVLADGSNADDGLDHRPGTRAGKIFGVRSPLAEVGLTKAEIRVLSHALGLPTWDQPASPCLASRVVYGLGVTPARLRQVERAEEYIRSHGFSEFRVRHHGNVARLEFAPAELGAGLALANEFARELRPLGFGRVVVDLEGYRRGALNEGVAAIAQRQT